MKHSNVILLLLWKCATQFFLLPPTCPYASCRTSKIHNVFLYLWKTNFSCHSRPNKQRVSGSVIDILKFTSSLLSSRCVDRLHYTKSNWVIELPFQFFFLLSSHFYTFFVNFQKNNLKWLILLLSVCLNCGAVGKYHVKSNFQSAFKRKRKLVQIF